MSYQDGINANREANPFFDAKTYHDSMDRERDLRYSVPWTSKEIVQITRLRLVTDLGLDFYDVSYCHCIVRDGSTQWVNLPFHQLPKSRRAGDTRATKAKIVEWAKRDGVYAKGLGIFDCISTLN